MLPQITVIPVEKVIDLIMENLIIGGVITEEEAKDYRKTVEQMDGQELITTLLESHAIREATRALSN